MKIKQLEWEDCIPTISSSVVSRAQALGYTLKIYQWLTPVDENDENDIISYGVDVESFGPIRDLDGTFPEMSTSIDLAKVAAQQWLESRIKEVVEVKAAEIQWEPREGGHLYSSCGRYRVHACSDGDSFVPQSFEKTPIDDAQTRMMWRSLVLLDNYAPKCFGHQRDAISVCQDHKQAEFESALKRYL